MHNELAKQVLTNVKLAAVDSDRPLTYKRYHTRSWDETKEIAHETWGRIGGKLYGTTKDGARGRSEPRAQNFGRS